MKVSQCYHFAKENVTMTKKLRKIILLQFKFETFKVKTLSKFINITIKKVVIFMRNCNKKSLLKLL